MTNSKINTSNIDGSNGFVIKGLNKGDSLGRSFSNAGDINNDGINDLIVGAYLATVDDRLRAGKSYVIFGKKGNFDENLDLSTLDGKNGFVIQGINQEDRSGYSVSSVGDFNNDGIDDLIIGAYFAEIDGKIRVGESYVVFGDSNIGNNGSLSLSNLDGNDGFVIEGIDAEDDSGYSVSSAGDVNNDGIDDLIIGAPYADEDNKPSTGESYVVFGRTDVGSSSSFQMSSLDVSSLDGSNGFVIKGADAGDNLGFSVKSAGDFNNDGIDDLIIGARLADFEGNLNTGKTYVVFGSSGLGSNGSLEVSSLNGTNGFVINGTTDQGESGLSVNSAGDINGDRVNDLIIGAPGSNNSYVIFGNSNLASNNNINGSINLSELDGTNGFKIEGIISSDEFGYSVSSVGDINGDRIDDLIIGARYANVNGINDAGQSYILYGGVGVGNTGTIKISELDGSNGFIVNGNNRGDNLGISVSGVGDINGDDKDDLIIGSAGANQAAGESYVLYGFSDILQFYIADFHGDNAAEILQREGLTGENALIQVNDSNSTIPTVENTEWNIQKIADFNSDKKADILWRNRVTGENAIWEMDGENVTSYDFIPELKDPAWEVQDAADFNADGKADVLWRNRVTGENAIWEMDGANVTSYDFITTVENTDWEIEAAADFNSDGKADILWRDRVTGENAIWEMDGANVTSYDFITTVENTDWEIEAAADFNGDGKADILWRNGVTEENAIWQIDGANVTSYDFITELGSNWKVAGVGDISGDNKTDILWRNYITEENTIWYMDGATVSGIFSPNR
ncbi:MAG: FG-GAP-like repeat-containing protein [Cyanobacteria bacterium P01_A01_bin.84]